LLVGPGGVTACLDLLRCHFEALSVAAQAEFDFVFFEKELAVVFDFLLPALLEVRLRIMRARLAT